MVDWKQVIGFDWDAGNERKSEEKHAVSRFEGEQVFFNQPLLVLADRKHSEYEERFHALGKSNNARLLHITFTLRSADTLIRIFSVRDMHRKERDYYEQS